MKILVCGADDIDLYFSFVFYLFVLLDFFLFLIGCFNKVMSDI